MLPKEQSKNGKVQLIGSIIPIIVLLTTLVCALIVIGTCTYLTNDNPLPPIQNIKIPPDFEITAFQLYSMYKTDEKAAENTYTGKTITVIGELASWEKEKGLFYITLFSDNTGCDYVRCNINIAFNPRDYSLESAMNPYLGRYIEVTGVCTGILNEYVIFINCTSNYLPPYLPE